MFEPRSEHKGFDDNGEANGNDFEEGYDSTYGHVFDPIEVNTEV